MLKNIQVLQLEREDVKISWRDFDSCRDGESGRVDGWTVMGPTGGLVASRYCRFHQHSPTTVRGQGRQGSMEVVWEPMELVNFYHIC